MNNISRITFGTWGLSEWRGYSKDYCRDLCRFAYNKGVTSFDTASVYGDGKSEEFLSTLPDDSFIATKIPARDRSNKLEEAYSSSWLIKKIDESRMRLKRDSLDLFQLHNWSYDWNDYDWLLSLMHNLKEKGVVKMWGISLPIDSPKEEYKIFEESIFETFQVHYNLIQQQNRELISYLKKKNKKVFLRSVLLHGFLLCSVNTLFENRYSSEKSELIQAREKVFDRIPLKDRFNYCLEDAFSTGADSVIIGFTKKRHLKGINKYL